MQPRDLCKVRSSRRSRAMEKHSRFGRKEQEEVWQNAEGDALRSLAAAGVRVPATYDFSEGVLIMELVVDGDGAVAPRLNDLRLSETLAREYHRLLIDQVVLMLCAGLIHGGATADGSSGWRVACVYMNGIAGRFS